MCGCERLFYLISFWLGRVALTLPFWWPHSNITIHHRVVFEFLAGAKLNFSVSVFNISIKWRLWKLWTNDVIFMIRLPGIPFKKFNQEIVISGVSVCRPSCVPPYQRFIKIVCCIYHVLILVFLTGATLNLSVSSKSVKKWFEIMIGVNFAVAVFTVVLRGVVERILITVSKECYF